jgi:hypothetical protein
MRRKPLSPDHATANTAVEHRLRAETNSPNDPSAVKLRHRQAIEHDREAASADTMYRRIREKTEPNQGDHPMSSTSTFAIRNLSVLAYANGFTLWHYKAGQARLETVAANYFADAADMLAVGDLIMISASDGARIMAVAIADVKKVVLAPLM